MAAMVVDWAAHRFGTYVEGRVSEYGRLLSEQAADRQEAAAGKKRSGRSSGSSGTASSRARNVIRRKIDLFSEAIHSGIPMEDVAVAKPKQRRSLRELVGAR